MFWVFIKLTHNLCRKFGCQNVEYPDCSSCTQQEMVNQLVDTSYIGTNQWGSTSVQWFRVYIHSLVTITSYDIYPLLVKYPWLHNVAILYDSCTTVWPVYSNILSSINLPSIQFPSNKQPGIKSVAQLFKMSLEHNQRIYWPHYYDLHQPKLSTQRWVIFIFFLHNWWSAILVSQCYYTFIFTCLLYILQSFFDCCVVDGSWNSAKGENVIEYHKIWAPSKLEPTEQLI